MSAERSVPPRPESGADTTAPELIAAAHAAARASRCRLGEAGAELARRPDHALDDEARARATLLVASAIAAAEGALRGAEPMLDAAPPIDLPRRFADAGLLARSGLAAAALVRADEHRLAAALRRVAGGGDPDPATAAVEAPALRLAEARRLDRAGEPLLPLHDLPAEDRHALFWQVAACLAHGALAIQGEARAGNEDATHRAAADAVARTLALIDDGEGIASAAMRHAHALNAARSLDDEVIAATLVGGRLPALAAMLAVRAGIGFEDARAMLASPAAAAMLLRACAVEREVAVTMVLALALALDRGTGSDPAAVLPALFDAFDRVPSQRALAEVRRSRLEPAYRDALSALDPDAGGRG